MSISGLFDLEPVRLTPFVQADLRLTPAQVRMASPALWAAPKGRQLYALVGGDESPEFLRHNRLIQQAWGARGAGVRRPAGAQPLQRGLGPDPAGSPPAHAGRATGGRFLKRPISLQRYQAAHKKSPAPECGAGVRVSGSGLQRPQPCRKRSTSRDQ